MLTEAVHSEYSHLLSGVPSESAPSPAAPRVDFSGLRHSGAEVLASGDSEETRECLRACHTQAAGHQLLVCAAACTADYEQCTRKD